MSHRRPGLRVGAFHDAEDPDGRADAHAYSEAEEDQLVAAFEAQLDGADCVILSDYAKGVLSPRVTRRVIDLEAYTLAAVRPGAASDQGPEGE